MPTRNPLAAIRDVCVIALCLALIAGSLAEAFAGPGPAGRRIAASPTSAT